MAGLFGRINLNLDSVAEFSAQDSAPRQDDGGDQPRGGARFRGKMASDRVKGRDLKISAKVPYQVSKGNSSAVTREVFGGRSRPNHPLSRLHSRGAHVGGGGPGRESLSNTLWISNPANLPKEDIIVALQSQCSEPFTVTEYLVNKGSVLFTLSAQDTRAVNAILKLSRKLLLKGQPVTVTRTNSRPAGMRPCLAPEARTALEKILGSRFNGGENALLLSNLVPDLVSAGLVGVAGSIPPAVWDSMASVVAENCPAIVALDLRQNGIATLGVLRMLLEKCPQVAAVELSSNALKSLDDLHFLKTLKNLTAIFLKDNPCAVDRVVVEQRVRKYLPEVQLIDGLPMAKTADQLLPPVQLFHVPGSVSEILLSFGRKYFTLFDNDRLHLLNAYHSEKSTFSLSIPATGRNLQDFARFSRNIYRNIGKTRLFVGSSNIVQIFQKFPKTDHDLNSLTVDVWRLSDNEICFNVSGTMSEELKFMRVFVLSPATAGSTAAAEGWQALVLCDQLHVMSREDAASSAGGKTAHSAHSRKR